MKLDISETKHANGAARLVLSGVVNIHTAMALRKQLKPMLNA